LNVSYLMEPGHFVRIKKVGRFLAIAALCCWYLLAMVIIDYYYYLVIHFNIGIRLHFDFAKLIIINLDFQFNSLLSLVQDLLRHLLADHWAIL
jgi:hypothetical protein